MSVAKRRLALLECLALLALALAAGDRAHAAAGLPQVELATRAPIPDEPKAPGTMRLRHPAGGYDGPIGIETRGQSTRAFPKQSFAIELREANGSKRDARLIGMPADDDWVLYASYNDKTLMRNVLAYATARALGRYAARTRFVELTLNGRYEGVYVLMERLELNRRRISVPGRGITGRYLLELTYPIQRTHKDPSFLAAVTRRPIVYADPERRRLTHAEARYARRYIAAVERALYRRRGGWRRLLDQRSAVDYVLLQELFRNVDAFGASTFMVKGAGRKLQLGPLWDFDLSTGNSHFRDSRSTSGWWTRGKVWSQRLFRDAGFRRALARRWRGLRRTGLRSRLLETVSANERALVRSGAAARTFARWPVLHVRIWPNPAARGSHAAEVAYLRGWLSRRIAWMDAAVRRLGR